MKRELGVAVWLILHSFDSSRFAWGGERHCVLGIANKVVRLRLKNMQMGEYIWIWRKLTSKQDRNQCSALSGVFLILKTNQIVQVCPYSSVHNVYSLCKAHLKQSKKIGYGTKDTSHPQQTPCWWRSRSGIRVLANVSIHQLANMLQATAKHFIQEFTLVCAFGVSVINFSLNCFYKLEFALKKKSSSRTQLLSLLSLVASAFSERYLGLSKPDPRAYAVRYDSQLFHISVRIMAVEFHLI